jgi:hypothetical protein
MMMQLMPVVYNWWHVPDDDLLAARLFYFGTYLPHLPPDAKEVMGWQKSHSSDDPSWLSFLKCYHFDYHWEHHR